MTDTVLIFNQKNGSPDTIEVFYTSPAGGNGTLIKSFVASNATAASLNYKAYIYPQSGTAPDPLVPTTIVVRDDSHFGAQMVNQVVPPGGTIRVSSSQTNGLNFYATGDEL